MQHEGNATVDAAAAACENIVHCWFVEHTFLARLVGSLLVFLASWLVIRYSRKAIERSARRLARLQRKDEYQAKALVGRTKPMQLLIVILVAMVAAITLLGIWGLQTAFTGLLAGAGFAGIVIGLAAADTIGDIVAGFLIFYNHPFDIGDWVEIDGVEGFVEDVQLGATTMVTWDNEKVTIPNGLVGAVKVKNFTHYRKLRRRLMVGVEYGSDLNLAMQTLKELAKAHPLVLKEPEPSAIAQGFGASSVDLVLRFYVEPVRSSAIQVYTDLIHQVHDTFRERGIKIAFPHMQVVQGRPWQLDEAGVGPGTQPGEPSGSD